MQIIIVMVRMAIIIIICTFAVSLGLYTVSTVSCDHKINTEASICFIFSFSYKVNSVRFQVQIICIHPCRVASVQQHAGSSEPIAVMGFLRQEKNTFKPKM